MIAKQKNFGYVTHVATVVVVLSSCGSLDESTIDVERTHKTNPSVVAKYPL